MQNKTDDNIWLDKIADSKYFTSDKDVKLLRYLVASTRDGKSLKENVIAMEVFKRDATFDSGSDSIVRSTIYNLRKKLDSYYLADGSKDAVRYVIPKGSYTVQFEKQSPIEGSNQPVFFGRNDLLLKGMLVICSVLMVLFASLYFWKDDSAKGQTATNQNPIWYHFVDSQNPLIIVLGDYFMMQKTHYPDSSFNFIRDPEINSQHDLADFLDKNPVQKKSLKKLGQSYFGEEIPSCLFQIIRHIKSVNKPVSMKYASELSLSDIKENDIIFIGDFGTLGTLNPFFLKTGIRYSTMPPGIFIINEKLDTLESVSLNNPDQSIFENDYALVSSVEAYEGKKILFFTSFLPFGKKEALYKLSEMSFLTEVTDQLSSFPGEWNLLMKISGLKSTGFYYEIIRFDQVD